MKKKINSKIFQRDAFIDTLYQYAKKDKKIILISNDQGAIALDNYKKKYQINLLMLEYLSKT